MTASTVRSQTPPMGWNSWDCYGTTVTESEVLANAEFMAERMRAHGWDTVVVDIAWYDPTARAHGYNADAPVALDGYGRPMPAPNRFPSAANGAGFVPLAGAVHNLDLRFGVHIMRGIPRPAVHADLPVEGTSYTAAQIADTGAVCEWNPDNYGLDHGHPGTQAYYDSFIAQLASWGVDFIKADDMLWPYRAADIEALALAIRRSGRDLELSLSPGRDLSLVHGGHLRKHATMWRVSDDLWDRWEDVRDQFARLARWAPHSGPGGWADADMIPLGRIGIRAERGQDRHSRLTPAEQQTLMSLWVIARSPLMVGADLPTSSPETIELLTNDRVLEVLRRGRSPREVLRERDLVVWRSESAVDGHVYAGVFHLGDEPVRVGLPGYHLGADGTEDVVELWSGTDQAWDDDGALTLALDAHGSALLRLAR
ncbi:glycoside hydrolase family 27 protein [Pseudactinotalea sp. Z1748]|uniref:glycoside hydrolase family 27 protein n=1 Tax=Pseudactinotalea sp. Z1748 TaxID=3413027 RepID=UPI003C7D880F